ncbi:unnamed protein product [Brachionus calyciflorus]|uniref:Uncharacterized protein n=1 Tax=Brachionus calyciflorus TaxID=104777 RepID=A0A813US81_9BILA|nr:unnamed protein product [Brachionus calyciflorus]
MIRRKLTRIEVTLDDTKELDDFFANKTSQIAPTSSNPNSSSNSKLSNLNYQKQLLFLSKKYELNQTSDSLILDTANLATNSNAANSTINTIVGDNIQAANQSTNNETESRFLFNPQPYNPSSSRFNQDN